MQLKMTSENVRRTYDAQGNAAEKVESINYSIVDGDGNTVGNANVGAGYANANITLGGFSSIDEGKEKLAAIFAQD